MTLADLVQATWPAARSHDLGPFTLRDGGGGGKRVSAASVNGPFTAGDLAQAETAMRAKGQPPLFVIWPGAGDFGLDDFLAQRGYLMVDPVVGYTADIAQLLTRGAPSPNCYAHWPPLAVTRDLWAAAGIGGARLAVMARVMGAKTALLIRRGDDPAGACFVALHGTRAMIHALLVAPRHRRLGLGQSLIISTAAWAQTQGAGQLSLVVTRGNLPARALYDRMGMAETAQYHYRQLPARA